MRCSNCQSRITLQQIHGHDIKCAHCSSIFKFPTERLLGLTFTLGWIPWILLEGIFLRFEHLALSVLTFLMSHLVIFCVAYATTTPTPAESQQPGTDHG
jgi:hypothetical protein